MNQYRKGEVQWAGQPRVLGNAEADAWIDETVRAIVRSRVHHRQLGVLADNYRQAFFLP